MISASAILISGVSAKHSAMADRLRALGLEYRQETTTQARRENIEQQFAIFVRRLKLTATSHILLYGATGVFSVMVIIISLSALNGVLEGLLFPLFLVGVTMLLTSSIYEIRELHLGNRTLLLDAAEATRRES